MNENFYSPQELQAMFLTVGECVQIHRTAVFFSPERISIGDHVRIDCFSILSAGLEGMKIGNYVHIGASSHLFGSGGEIQIENFANISSRVSLFTHNDDYTHGTMTSPLIPSKYKQSTKGGIMVKKHVIIGCGSVLLPDITLETGASVGALSLVNRSVKEFEIVAGTPIRTKGQRNKRLLSLEKQFLEEAKLCH